ncbi:unnamed protein product [Linum trigynum]|uniref:Uncharacterized protein n=1 Tax=Linum trigynum TaxID=586398 RepID=A0AAV2CTC3_9ROSI
MEFGRSSIGYPDRPFSPRMTHQMILPFLAHPRLHLAQQSLHPLLGRLLVPDHEPTSPDPHPASPENRSSSPVPSFASAGPPTSPTQPNQPAPAAVRKSDRARFRPKHLANLHHFIF